MSPKYCGVALLLFQLLTICVSLFSPFVYPSYLSACVCLCMLCMCMARGVASLAWLLLHSTPAANHLITSQFKKPGFPFYSLASCLVYNMVDMLLAIHYQVIF